MDKAYDVIFQNIADASVIAKATYQSQGDRFRYRCLYCSEEVYLAAADSTERAPHFRHRRGNNNIDCERYLGQPGAIESYALKRDASKIRIGFCFNIDYKTFEICVSMTSEEIEKNFQNQVSMCFGTGFQMQPFLSVPISKQVLKPNVSNYFTISEYANDYYLSFTGTSPQISYIEVIKKEGKINIYKVNKQDGHYKKNTSDLLYTDTEYLAVSESEEGINILLTYQEIEMTDDSFSFFSLGRQFYAAKFLIKYATYDLKLFLMKNDYQIDNAEVLDFLWPPMFYRDSSSITTCDEIYVASSFKMIPSGNINVEEDGIKEIDQGIYKIAVKDMTVIYEKNVEEYISKEILKEKEYASDSPLIVHEDIFITPDDYDYFLFDIYGCTRLNAGAKVFLSTNDKIIGYKNGHIKVYVYSSVVEKGDLQKELRNILMYHPQLEPFNPDEFMSIDVNECIIDYLETCYRSGTINSVVKKLIEEKKI